MNPSFNVAPRSNARPFLLLMMTLSLFAGCDVFPQPVAPSVIRYVRQAATGANNGSSWTDAYTDLQSALTAARAPNSGIKEIWVAQGTYKPHATDPAVSFELVSGVALYGGFTGSETQRDQRNNVTNRASLSGDLSSNDGPNLANRSDNSDRVVSITSGNGATIIDGFTIQSGTSDVGGSGMVINGGNPVVNACGFQDNAATAPSSRGGAMIIGANTTPTLTGCTFTSNSAQSGGAVWCQGSAITFSTCKFSKNTANRAAALDLSLSTVTLQDCTFEENIGNESGAIESAGGLQVIRCKFTSNRANNGTGGAFAGTPNMRVINSTFTSNFSKFLGGAIDNRADNVTFAGCLFNGNISDSGNGGGIYTQGKMMKILNCTFAGNRSFGGGGGVQAAAALETTLTNCILWGNTSSSQSPPSVEERQLDTNAQVEVPIMNNCCVEGLSGLYGGTGNIGTNPNFASGFALSSNSPCINAGSNSAVPFDLSEDVDGGPRLLGTPPVVDMGAFEF